MKEFLISNYSLLTFTIEMIAALTGVFCWKKFSNTPVKYFIVFLLFIFFADSLGNYTKLVIPNEPLEFLINTKFEKNHWWSNTYWNIGTIMFFTFYYRKILKTKHFKTLIKLFSYSFLLFSIIYIIINWHAFFNHFFIVLSLSGAFIIFLCTVLYFIEILLSERILVFYKSINFYVSATIFIWWLIITPLTFYDVYSKYEISSGVFDREFIKLKFFIYLFANMFMYITFTFAFIWCKPENEL